MWYLHFYIYRSSFGTLREIYLLLGLFDFMPSDEKINTALVSVW